MTTFIGDDFEASKSDTTSNPGLGLRHFLGLGFHATTSAFSRVYGSFNSGYSSIRALGEVDHQSIAERLSAPQVRRRRGEVPQQSERKINFNPPQRSQS